ncbi:metal-sensitive transcriptional regulator [Nocardioides sp. TF02-7]|uniref:metal-sensitive transcriptional regulator n=1 Tax=Nocardioides sp. TF02-7 TaxID=2917724 RepID=UPI001F05389B|nr:metal-sensitive transcriptional regulator [Nocardioides sp. TF02-7]UMG91087.1 metal-sensitive transcriptional regulator [Nocardioides sp. TF02-7]
MVSVVSEHQHGYLHRKDDHLERLRRIEGQARGLQRMVEEEQYCIDILTQVSAMTSALQSFSLQLLEEHMNHCVADALGAARSGEASDQAASDQVARDKVAEAVAAITRLVRS